MPTISAEEQVALQDAVRRLLADHCAEADVRRTIEAPTGFDSALWMQLAEMGLSGLIVDPEYGGAGAGPEALERVMEEAGSALLCSPLLSSAVLAAGLLEAIGDVSAKARLLPGIADGSSIATVALTGANGGWTSADVAVTALESGQSWSLIGLASFVTHGAQADLILVVGRTSDGLGVFEVDPKAPGLVITELPTFDHTLRLAHIKFEGVAARKLVVATPVWDAVEQALDLVRVALAGEQAGGARRVLDFTVDYTKTRAQFGRAIGSFQAIKHMAADLLLEVESAISAARAAAAELARESSEARAAIDLAAFACADAYCAVTAASIQMHGGIGFTWDHPAHLYLRRARADAQLFGTPAAYRERYLRALGA